MDRRKCPSCGCPFLQRTGIVTADMPRAWQDTDGTWYCGPAREDITVRCMNCGWHESVLYERGKRVLGKGE